MTRKLIEQMLDCIEELRYSNTTHAADTICDSAITAARAYLAQPEQSDAMLACDITPRPLQYPLSDYHVAMSEGPLHFTWTDKPHRLVYDLIAAVKYYAAPQLKAPEPLTDEEIYAAIRPLYTSESLARNVLEISIDEYRAVLAAQRSKE